MTCLKPSHLLACTLICFLIACASPATSTASSGLTGQVTLGPVCPVQQANNPCPDQPYQATVVVLDSNRKQVTQFQTDAQGNFKINLAPGAYTLVPRSPGVMPHAPEQTVTVIQNTFTQVTIVYDSGIR